MPLTLIEAAKDAFDAGKKHEARFIALYAQSTPILSVLPFEDVPSGVMRYDREEALSGIGFRGVNEAFPESTGVINPQTETVAIAGGDFDIDTFILDTKGNGQRARQESMKVKATAHRIGHAVIKGDVQADNKEFDGLQARLVTTGSQVIPAIKGAPSAGGDPLSLLQIDAAIDATDGATHLIMPQALRRRFSEASRDPNVGGHINFTQDSFGRQQTVYAGLPILDADPNSGAYKTLGFNEAGPGGGVTSASIYVVSFRLGYLNGIQTRAIQVRDLGELQEKPAKRTRVEWSVGLALYNPRAATRVWGISDAAITK